MNAQYVLDRIVELLDMTEDNKEIHKRIIMLGGDFLLFLDELKENVDLMNNIIDKAQRGAFW